MRMGVGSSNHVPGDYQKKPMKTYGKEITKEWLYHLGVPTEKIASLPKKNSAVCVPTIDESTLQPSMPRAEGRPSR